MTTAITLSFKKHKVDHHVIMMYCRIIFRKTWCVFQKGLLRFITVTRIYLFLIITARTQLFLDKIVEITVANCSPIILQFSFYLQMTSLAYGQALNLTSLLGPALHLTRCLRTWSHARVVSETTKHVHAKKRGSGQSKANTVI